MIAIAGMIEAPNDAPSDTVYMDRVPASMLARMRADITVGALRLLRRGHKKEALEMALRTHREYGRAPYTLQAVKMGDSVFSTEKEFGSLFIELGDSLGRDDLLNVGESYHKESMRRRAEWERYRKTLSPRMRLNMSKTP